MTADVAVGALVLFERRICGRGDERFPMLVSSSAIRSIQDILGRFVATARVQWHRLVELVIIASGRARLHEERRGMAEGIYSV